MDEKKMTLSPQRDDVDFYKQVADMLTAARKYAKMQLDSTIAATYFEIGRMIVEREQQGHKRAKYGSALIKGLSDYLTEQYGRGFSIVNLQSIRKFYQVYAPSIQQTSSVKFDLSWSHYQVLMRIENEDARHFYEEDSNIYASAYSLYLPDKVLLQRKLAEWTREFEEEHEGESE